MLAPKEATKVLLGNLFQKAIESGAEPAPILTELEGLQERMRMAYWNGDLESALQIAEEIGRKAQPARDAFDRKWTTKLEREGITKNYLEDPEYLQDFANIYALGQWLESYGSDGSHIVVLREYADGKDQGKLRFLGPGLS